MELVKMVMSIFLMALVFLSSGVYSSTIIKLIENSIIREKRTAGTGCAIPANINVLFESLNTHMDNTFLRAVNASQPVSLFENELNNNEISISSLSTNCPSETTNDAGANEALWSRSTCPWYYQSINLGSNYYPQVLPQAKCKCRSCLYARDNSDTGCERIYTNVRVMKQSGCTNGFYTYDYEIKEVSVGCTCAKPKTSS